MYKHVPAARGDQCRRHASGGRVAKGSRSSDGGGAIAIATSPVRDAQTSLMRATVGAPLHFPNTPTQQHAECVHAHRPARPLQCSRSARLWHVSTASRGPAMLLASCGPKLPQNKYDTSVGGWVAQTEERGGYLSFRPVALHPFFPTKTARHWAPHHNLCFTQHADVHSHRPALPFAMLEIRTTPACRQPPETPRCFWPRGPETTAMSARRICSAIPRHRRASRGADTTCNDGDRRCCLLEPTRKR